MAEIRETLTKKLDIQSLFRYGQRIQNKYFTIVFKKNGLAWSRFLFTTDKSCKNSVQRNRIKRICREHIRDLPELPNGYDIAIVGKWELNSLPFLERVSLFHCLKKLR